MTEILAEQPSRVPPPYHQTKRVLSAHQGFGLCVLELNTLAEFGHEKCKFTTAEDRNKLDTKTRLRLGRVEKMLHKEENEAVCLKLHQERIGAPSCGWTDECGSLQRLCSLQLSSMTAVEGDQRSRSILLK